MVAKKGAIVVKSLLMMLLVITNKTLSQTEETKGNNGSTEWIYVEGGSFNMGSNDSDDRKPVHRVTISSFYIGKSEVTVKEYRAYCQATGTKMPHHPSSGWDDTFPVVNVSWNDAQAYCKWAGVRLPTEAEWEYAARGGNKSKGYKYSGSDNLDSVAWYEKNSDNKVHEVAKKQPNELGLYDMSGNLWEWCSDWYGAYESKEESFDPKGPETGSVRVLRGGSWSYGNRYCDSSYRYISYPDYWINYFGFRCVKPVNKP